MNKFRFAFKVIALVVFALATTSLVHAQASRTWVSGVGDDVNPCSRTAPCKTFAGAISKTATGGEIDALDPGGFGAVTITKAITIDGDFSGLASALVSGVNGINVNAAGANVTLRRIAINGITGLGIKGINVSAVGVLNVEDCYIFGFANEGIFVNLGTGANINIKRSTIVNNGLSNSAGNGAGIRVTTSDNGSGVGHTVYVTVTNTNCDNNNEGYRFENNVRGQITESTGSNNALNGFDVFPGAASSEMNLESCTSANNKQWGIFVFTSGTIRISNTTVTGNITLGLNPSAGGQILSYSNNKVQGNPGGNGAVSGPVPQV